MLAQRRPDEQVYVGPTSFSNVGPTESTTEKLRWPNVVMLSGEIPGVIDTLSTRVGLVVRNKSKIF